MITTSQGVELIRDDADAHEGTHHEGEAGNPHIWLDPENVAIMLRHITEALVEVDPSHTAEFRTNQAAYLQRLGQLQKELLRAYSAAIRPAFHRSSSSLAVFGKAIQLSILSARFICSRVQNHPPFTCNLSSRRLERRISRLSSPRFNSANESQSYWRGKPRPTSSS